jgi:hypothetical protein
VILREIVIHDILDRWKSGPKRAMLQPIDQAIES